MRRRTTWLAAVSAILFAAGSACAQDAPASGLYQIISGRYTEYGGFVGTLNHILPEANQTFVELTVDSEKSAAQMKFLGQDMRTVFSIPSFEPCCGGFIFNLSSGRLFPDHIEFGTIPLPGQQSLSYRVSNSADALRISGTVGRSCTMCSDIPTLFKHTNVVAVLLPAATIRVSEAGMNEVEICWKAASTRKYQVQYRSGLGSNAWTDLGAPVIGTGTTNCTADTIPPAEPQRFYRVILLP